MTPNLASIEMSCILRHCWSNRMKPVSVPLPPSGYFYSKSVYLAWRPPIDKWHYTFCVSGCTVTYIWTHTHTLTPWAINMSGGVRNHPCFSKPFNQWLPDMWPRTCPCLPRVPFFCMPLLHSPKVYEFVCVCMCVFLWGCGRLFVRQTDDSKPSCFTSATPVAT